MRIQHPFRLAGQLATASALAFILAACGGGNGSASTSTAASSSTTTTSSGGTTSTTVTAAQVSTVAGSGASGLANGAGTAATFNDPASIAIDANANIYVADTGNSLIRKIDASGNVTTLAGSSSQGSTNGLGTAASFALPNGIAADASGNVYVADSGNNEIRKIDTSGNVTTFAGSGTSGSANGLGVAASFNFPTAVAVDASGNVYVADTFNHEIRKITPSGNVTTLAGSGTQGSANGLGTAASFNTPRGITVDTSGIVYVADSTNNLIRRIDTSGNVTTLAGAGAKGTANGQGTAASFNNPFGVTVDTSGNLYVADTSNNLIRKIDASGNVTTLAGSGAQGSVNGQVTASSFNLPHCVAINTSGTVFIADTPNNLIRKITPAH